MRLATPPRSTAPGGARAPRPAIFLDKDGTLVEDVPYNVDPAHLRWTAAAPLALRRFAQAGWPLVLVSNQQGVGLGRFDMAALETLAAALTAALAAEAIELTGFYACPHVPGTCACRKPFPGLLLEAARDHHLDLERSWMIGDILDDIEAGHRAGCRAVLLDVGNETEWRDAPGRTPDLRARDLGEAADAILAACASGCRPSIASRTCLP